MTVKKEQTVKKEPVKPVRKPEKKAEEGQLALTKDEALSLMSYIQENLLDQIRDDPDWDNFAFTKRIFDIWGKLEVLANAAGWAKPVA